MHIHVCVACNWNLELVITCHHKIHSNMQASILLIAFFISPTPLLLVSSQNHLAVAKPNCDDRCGNITIPFPFGTSEECYQSFPFWVSCAAAASSDPPKLFWQNNTLLEVREILPEGQMKLMRPPARKCYTPAGGQNASNDDNWIKLAKFFTVNITANKFTMVSCNAEAVVNGTRLGGGKFRTGCTAMCTSKDDVMEGSCVGLGCCQTSIPKNVWWVEVDLEMSGPSDVNNCSYAFVVEEGAFRFSSENLTNFGNVQLLPMVVDWVVAYGTCDQEKKNASSYACKSANSVCYDSDNGDGYRCRCEDGYQGNPYLDHGCEDIDECADISRNKCLNKQSCRNTAGDYTCSCNRGFSGDGREPNGCTDINECEEGIHECMEKAACLNTDGDYTCSCRRGYSGNGRGRDGCQKQDLKIAFIVAGVASGIILLLLAAMLLYMDHKKRSSEKTKQKLFLRNGGVLLEEKLRGGEGSAEVYSANELQKATDDFHNDRIIGQGGFGTVYKGFLPGDKVVAIKKSKRVDPNEIEQFINEVIVLSQINHRNVVRLLGCCLEMEVPLLVYEFINNGTLASHLHNPIKARFLHWATRLKIAAEAAGVLSYLHSAASTPIIHRDVKSDNILLDLTFTAKVSDFGASKLVPLDQTELMTVVQGTFGYLDPEYMQTHQLTEKSDVYSFGVVLVELLTGRMAISNNRSEEERNLVLFFLFILKQGRLFEILDENVGEDEDMEEISQVANLAKECLSVKGEDRPSMKEVAMELEGLIIGGKHKWARNVENVEEMESLLEKGEATNYFGNGDGNSLSVGYDSIRDHVVLPLSGGR